MFYCFQFNQPGSTHWAKPKINWQPTISPAQDIEQKGALESTLIQMTTYYCATMYEFTTYFWATNDVYTGSCNYHPRNREHKSLHSYFGSFITKALVCFV